MQSTQHLVTYPPYDVNVNGSIQATECLNVPPPAQLLRSHLASPSLPTELLPLPDEFRTRENWESEREWGRATFINNYNKLRLVVQNLVLFDITFYFSSRFGMNLMKYCTLFR